MWRHRCLVECPGGRRPLGPGSGQGKQVANVQVPGDGHRLLLTRQAHPRGGFQYHLYVEVAGDQVELTDANHNPVVPFVATDTRPTTLVSADCGPGGFTVSEAEPVRGSGALSWDVYRTSYRLDGSQAIPLRHRKVYTGLSDKRLRSRLADLHDGRMFASCQER